jgi:hypothetical protein
MHCEDKITSHNTSYCIIVVVTNAVFTVYNIFIRRDKGVSMHLSIRYYARTSEDIIGKQWPVRKLYPVYAIF